MSNVARALTYGDWTERLCAHFFRPERAGTSVTFFVDDDLLGELEGSDDPDKGAASLVAAVRPRLSKDSYGHRLARLESESIAWKVKGGESCPLSLPLLALAVLAATRMAREDGIGANNYWTRCEDLLGVGTIGSTDRDVFPILWDHLTWWLDEKNGGGLGQSTVKRDDTWTIIGYALSQALFRDSDRQHLTDLFERLGLAPGEDVDLGDLLKYFRAWAPGSRLSNGAKHMAGDDRYDDRLLEILEEEVGHWDGVIRDEHGRRVGAVLLTYKGFPRPAYEFGILAPEGFPAEARFAGEGITIDVHSLTPDVYAETVEATPLLLREGIRLESGDFVLAYRASTVVPLAQNELFGRWASVTHIEPGHPCCLLVADALVAEARAYLSPNARSGWRERTERGAAPRGWTLFQDVIFEEAPAERPRGPLGILFPTIRERPTLRGGLPIDRNLALYLSGGEPDLWLPSLLDDPIEVTVDGRRVAGHPGGRLELRGLQLKEGTHTVKVEDLAPLYLTTVPGEQVSPPGAGTVGYRLRCDAGRYRPLAGGPVPISESPDEHEVAVAGARLVGVPSNLPPAKATVVLPIGAQRYLVIGPTPGDICPPAQPARPAWMTSVGEGNHQLYPVGFEYSTTFEVVWIVVGWRDHTDIRLVDPAEPSTGNGSSPNAAAWCDAFGLPGPADPAASGLWSRYKAVATTVEAGS